MHGGGSRRGLSTAQRTLLGVGLTLVTAAVTLAERSPEGSSAARLWDNVHWTLAYAFATAVAWPGYRAAAGATRAARGWFFAALVAMTVGQCMWDLQVLLDFNPFPGPSDAPFLCVGAFILIGLATQLGSLRRAERIAYGLDGLGIGIAVLTLTLALYIPRRGDFGTFAAIILVAYPVLLLGGAGMALVVVLAHRVRPTRAHAHFFVSLLALGTCWILWNWQTLAGTLTDAAPLNYAFSYATLSFGVAASRFELLEHRATELERPYYVVSSSVPLLLVLLASLALVFGQELGPITYVAIRVCVVVVVLVAVARQSLLLRERDHLLATERVLRETEARFAQLAESIDEVFVITAPPADRPLYVGPAFDRIAGASAARLLDGSLAWTDVLHEDDRARFVQAMSEPTGGFVLEYRLVRPDGAVRWVRDRRTRLGEGEDARRAGIVEDITERRLANERNAELQTLLAKSERLKSIGTLAGGIAHDFNNILAAVLGNAEIVSATLPPSGRSRTAIDGILVACERARDLVRRMLAFARQEDMEARPVRLGDVAREVQELLRPVVPSSIRMTVEVGDDVPPALVDPSQLHQVIVNLVTNAAHAIGDRPGTITIGVRARLVRRGEVVGVGPGRFVELTVADDGVGMDDATRARIFDPFFTTKRPGEGTGLGLSMVHGIVSSHGGAIDVQSSVGRGTTFHILIPTGVEPIAEDPPAAEGESVSRPADDIEVLVVDDDEIVVRTLALVLASLRVRAMTTRSPDEALALVAERPDRFALVITDMTMPEMRGDELGERIKEVAPSLPLVLVSGNDVAADPAVFSAVLAKPYTRAMLAEAIERLVPSRARTA